MKNLTITLFLFLCLPFVIKAQDVNDMVSNGMNFLQIQDSCNKRFIGKDITQLKGWKNYKRWEDFWSSRVSPSGEFPNPDITWNEWSKLKNRNNDPSRKKSNQLFASSTWKLLGPTTRVPSNGGGAGRVNAIRFNPDDGEQVWLGTPAGGLWKTTNFGSTWQTTTDSLLNLGVSDIAINPQNPNQMFISTGDGDGGHTFTYGVLRSDDAGRTWIRTALNFTVSQTRQTSRLVINPNQPNILLCATDNGLFRTTNSGDVWTQVQTGNIKDIEFKVDDPAIVYATAGVNFYRSTNSGETWTKITTGLSGVSGNRMAIGVTLANPEYIYALVSNNRSGFGGVYRSTDAGLTWSQRSNGTSINILNWDAAGTYDPGADQQGQGYYDLAIAVSQANANMVYCGGVNIWRSTDGGSTWDIKAHWQGNGAAYVHADIHDLIFIPGTTNPEYLCAATDGGVFYTSDNGNTWKDISDGLQILQFYKIAVDPSNITTAMGGCQDNGTNRYQDGNWKKVNNGDGMDALFERGGNYAYSTIYYGSLYRSSTNAQTFSTQRVYPQPGYPAGAWVSPIMLNPARQSSIYIGVLQRIYRSNDRGDTWFRLSTAGFGTYIKSMAISPSDTAQLWATTDTKIWRSANSGATFTDVTSNAPSNNISNCATNPSTSGQCVVTYSGYNPNSKVYFTKDSGTTWTNITKTGLPNVPVQCASITAGIGEPVIFVGTDLGVFYTKESLSEWLDFNDGFPNVIVNDLEINGTTMRAGTFGRGLWEVQIDKALAVNDNNNLPEFIQVYPNPSHGNVSLKIQSEIESSLILRVTDLNGREVLNLTDNVHVGVYTKDLLLTGNAAGIYTVEIQFNNKVFVTKLIKE
ncbi:MAG: T9SS type A sorting domain-containing protein [Candidatus Kapaibacterium sp.]|nr:T9SS type A sorting domain-containing protein [Bacteroidota bacterium]